MAAAAALLALAAAVAAQPPDPAGATAGTAAGGDDAVFVDHIDVDLVDIDVYVADREGRPVTGLSATDFVVREDGRPVEITNFYAIEKARAAAPPERPAGGAAVAAAPDVAPPPLPVEQRLWLIVYVDNFNLIALERNRILGELESFVLRTVEPEDRAMLVTFDRSSTVRQPFTGDARRLADAIAGLDDLTGHRSVQQRLRAEALAQINQGQSESLALSQARFYADSVLHDLELSLDALRDCIDSLSGLPGRKALVYVSSGLPLTAGEELFHAVDGRYPLSSALSEIPRFDASRRFQRLGVVANANRVAFYTLDAGGLRANTLGAAEHSDLWVPGLAMRLDSVIHESQQSGLRFIAEETGGSAILNRNDAGTALDRVADQLDTFYSLGYPSLHAGDGRYHHLEVEVRRPGVEVRHRGGYRALSADDRMVAAVRAALLHAVTADPLGLEVEVRPERLAEGDLFRVPIRIAVPLANLVLLPRGDGRVESRMALFVGAIDDRGRMSQIDRIPLGLRLAEENVEAARGESFVYTHELLMRRGRQRVAFGLRDELGAQEAFVWRALAVGE